MEELLQVEKLLVGEIWTSTEVYDNVVTLCDEFGSRFAGTPGEKAAVDFMLKKMQEYGLENVRPEEFEYTGWIRGEARLEVVDPIQREFPCIGLPYSPTAQVEAELCFIGDGHPDTYAKRENEINGRIAMVTTRSPAFLGRGMHRMEKYGRAVAAGAVGFIWMRSDPGLLEETGSLRFNKAAEIPGVGISKETGDALLRLAKKYGKLKLRLTTQSIIKPMKSWNVVGELVGQSQPEDVMVVGAHFDGHDIAPGARDDASGAAVVLEAARALAKHRQYLAKTVRFVCFPCEEIGLIGSFAYIEAHRETLKRHQFMLNLDMAGSGGTKMVMLQGWDELIPYFNDIAARMKQGFAVASQLSPYSDMYPFAINGVPAAMLGNAASMNSSRGFGHTAADTVDKVSLRGLREDSIFVARLMLHLASDTKWPGQHKDFSEMKKKLADQGLLEIMKYESRDIR